MPITRRALCAAAAALLFAAGCSTARPPRPAADDVVFAGPVTELVPLHPGDTFVDRVSRERGGDSIARTAVSALEKPGELRVQQTNGDSVSYVHLRVGPSSIDVISVLDLANDIGLLYDPPLPLFTTPVRAGEQRARCGVTLVRPSDGAADSTGTVDQVMTAARESDGRIMIRSERTLALTDRPTLVIVETRWVKPGIGEVQAETSANGKLVSRHQQLCATIAGKPIGTCPAE